MRLPIPSQKPEKWRFTGAAVFLFVLIFNAAWLAWPTAPTIPILGGGERKSIEKDFQNKTPRLQFSLLSQGLISVFSFSSATPATTNNGGNIGGPDPNISLGSVQGNALLSLNSPASDPLQFNTRSQIITHAVKEGEVPSIIAADYGISTNTLLWANDLVEGEIIRPEQKLAVPPVDGVVHKTESGETVAGIAKKYKGSASSIIAFNQLPADGRLRPGQTLIIPDGEKPAPVFIARHGSAKTLAGYFIMPTSGRNWGRLHPTNAVDIANACGTAVYAAAPGTITRADGVGWNGGYGRYVKIDHDNGTATLYAHLLRILKPAGERVNQGGLIGLMGTSGRSTGCHLHLEVYGARNPFAK